MVDRETIETLREKLALAERALARSGRLVGEEERHQLRRYIDMLRAQIGLFDHPHHWKAEKIAAWRARGAVGPLVVDGGRARR